jgi:hypothetical protein
MSFYLKINTEHRQANNAQIISLGKCDGFLEVVPQKDSLDKYIDNWEHWSGSEKIRWIFVCDSITMSLRPLLPYACGFLFRDGTNLSHFANILRRHHICACIDKGLWHWAFNAAHNQKNSIRAEYVCGSRKEYSEQIKASYRYHLDNYLKIIEEKPILLPVYDVKHDVFKEPDAISPVTLGAKALSVNALKNAGFTVPNTLILSGISESLEPEMTHDPVWTVLQKVFAELEKHSDGIFMLRASLHTDPKSKINVSGMIKTASFQTRVEFENLYQEYVRTWAKLRSSMPGMGLSIVIQEQIPASLFGVVFTRLPWDYLSDKMIFDLSLKEVQGSDSGNIQLTAKDYIKISPAQRKLSISKELELKLSNVLPLKYNEDRFYTSLSEFLSNCIELQQHYMVPLDIEFAITDDFQFFYTQFRYIYFM